MRELILEEVEKVSGGEVGAAPEDASLSVMSDIIDWIGDIVGGFIGGEVSNSMQTSPTPDGLTMDANAIDHHYVDDYGADVYVDHDTNSVYYDYDGNGTIDAATVIGDVVNTNTDSNGVQSVWTPIE